ncbi:hypothetical protein [uncultured Bacteroides sp.]|jgi:hypothetical protein|uniref:hypothetical protein n=1 Tax=uncultured Bacteroides sp. TaxID=162156 RepID=UPI0020491D73|nr:hypothetical protein [uncultured Bacteroides sp.]DAO06489.1 MAG TPA: hypothetical protein [Caudoviricetes sp.]
MKVSTLLGNTSSVIGIAGFIVPIIKRNDPVSISYFVFYLFALICALYYAIFYLKEMLIALAKDYQDGSRITSFSDLWNIISHCIFPLLFLEVIYGLTLYYSSMKIYEYINGFYL